jgi:hypothetical protein
MDEKKSLKFCLFIIRYRKIGALYWYPIIFVVRNLVSESPSLVLVINDTKLLMPCVKWFKLGISNTCDEGACGMKVVATRSQRDGIWT